jgi:putative transposase
MTPPVARNEVLLQKDAPSPGQQTLWRVVWVTDQHSWLIKITFERPPAWPKRELNVAIANQLGNGILARSGFILPDVYSREDADPKAPDYHADDPTKISVEHQAIRDERYRTIEGLVTPAALKRMFPRRLAGKLVAAVAELTNHARTYVYDALKLYFMLAGNPNALCPLTWRCGAPGKEKPATTAKRGRTPDAVKLKHDVERTGINCEKPQRELLKATFLEVWRPGMTLGRLASALVKSATKVGKAGHDGSIEMVPPPPHKWLTKGQIRYWLKSIFGTYFILRKSVSPQTFDLSKRGMKHRARNGIWYPTQRYEIDSTILDLYLVSAFNPAWLIGRPIVYFIIDVMSGAIVGFHIALSGPNGIGAKAACYNAFSNKAALLTRLEIIKPGALNPWEMHYICDLLTSDRGEMFNARVHHAFARGTTKLEILKALRGDLKPFVERIFRTTNDRVVHWLPGAVRERKRERGTRDYRLDACLNIFQLHKLIANFAIFYNTSRDASGYAPTAAYADLEYFTPQNLFAWGLANADGAPLTLSRGELIPRFLEPIEAKVARDGIYVGSARYGGETPDREHWAALARTYGRDSITVYNEPAWGSEVYWLNQKTNEFEAFQRLEANIPSLATLIEVADRDKYLELCSGDQAGSRQDKEQAFDETVNDIVRPAAEAAKEARANMSNADVVSDVAEKRAHENQKLFGTKTLDSPEVPSPPDVDGQDDDLLNAVLKSQLPKGKVA